MALTAAGSIPLQRERVQGQEDDMPAEEVMDKFKKGKLHSGSKDGPIVHDRDKAIAIMMSEREKEKEGKKEYQPHSGMAERFRMAAEQRRKK